MSSLSNAGKHLMLDAFAVACDDVSIHTGDPGAAGTSNEVTGNGYERLTPSFDPATGGGLPLAAGIEFDGPPNEDALWFGLWGGSTFLGRGQITEGDSQFNASGKFTFDEGVVLGLNDPA